MWPHTTSQAGSHKHAHRPCQVEQLVRERKYEEALILCENLAVEDESQRNSMRKMIKTLHAYSLFANGACVRRESVSVSRLVGL